jgi:putative polyhydroxyalkanoate system protein
MSEIDIRRRHRLAHEDARRLAEQVARRLGREFQLRYRWDGDVLRFQRDGVQGTLTVQSQELRLHARLGLLLSLAGPAIERAIHAHLDQALASADPGDEPDAA